MSAAVPTSCRSKKDADATESTRMHRLVIAKRRARRCVSKCSTVFGDESKDGEILR